MVRVTRAVPPSRMTRSSSRCRSTSMKITSTTTSPTVASTSAMGPSVARRPASPAGGGFSTTTGCAGFFAGAAPSFCSSPMTSLTVDCAFSSESDLPTRRTWRILPVMLCLYCGRSSASVVTCETSSHPSPPSTETAKATVTTTATTRGSRQRCSRSTIGESTKVSSIASAIGMKTSWAMPRQKRAKARMTTCRSGCRRPSGSRRLEAIATCGCTSRASRR